MLNFVFFLKKKWSIPGLFFFYFRLFNTVEGKQMFHIKVCWWLDSSRGPMESEATALQLSHNHCPRLNFVGVDCVSKTMIDLSLDLPFRLSRIGKNTFFNTFSSHNWTKTLRLIKTLRVKNFIIKMRQLPRAGIVGLVVMGEESCLRDREFECRHRIQDRTFFTFTGCEKLLRKDRKSCRGLPIF